MSRESIFHQEKSNFAIEQNSCSMEKNCINLNKILYDSILNNKTILLGTLTLFVGFYLQDTIFTQHIANITRDIPNFVKNIDVSKVISVLSPFVAAIIIFYLANIIISKNLSKIELDVTHELSSQIIESIKTTKKKINVNELMIQIKKVTNTKNIYKLLAVYIIPTIVVILSVLYNFMRADLKTGFVVIVMIIILILVTVILECSTIDAVYEGEKSLNNLYDGIHETMTNIDTVITSSTKNKELCNIDIIKDDTYNLTYISEFKNGNTTYGLQVLSLLAAIGINYISYRLYVGNHISSGVLITNVLLTLLFMDYYNYCVNAIKEVASNIGKLYDANEYFSSFEIVPESKGKYDLVVTEGNIQLKNIAQNYKDKVVFDNVSIEIDGNCKTGIIGPIGSGKSTLLKIISGIVDYKGNIYIDSQNLKQCTNESITKNIAYISQHPKLFNQSILYNISYGTNYNKQQIVEKLNELGLMEFINTFPDGLHTIVGKEGSSVSGGQRQFISFIRSIIQNKCIILLDEPSSSLDQKSKQLLINLIRRLNKKTIIITTHDKDLLPIFDKIIDNPSKQTKIHKDVMAHNRLTPYREMVIL